MELKIKFNTKELYEIYKYMMEYLPFKTVEYPMLKTRARQVFDRYNLYDLYDLNGLTEIGINTLISLHFFFTSGFEFKLQKYNYYEFIDVSMSEINTGVWNRMENDIIENRQLKPYDSYLIKKK